MPLSSTTSRTSARLLGRGARLTEDMVTGRSPVLTAPPWSTRGPPDEARPSVVGAQLVLDDVQPLLAELRQVVEHPPERLRVVPLPAVHLADDAQRRAGAVGLGGVAGEALVGHVRVVLERAQRLDDVDASPLPGPGQRRRQLRSPGRRVD